MKYKYHASANPSSSEKSITQEISDNTERKHRAIEQAIKIAGPRREASTEQLSRL